MLEQFPHLYLNIHLQCVDCIFSLVSSSVSCPVVLLKCFALHLVHVRFTVPHLLLENKNSGYLGFILAFLLTTTVTRMLSGSVIRVWFNIIVFTGFGHLQAIRSYTSSGTGRRVKVLTLPRLVYELGNLCLVSVNNTFCHRTLGSYSTPSSSNCPGMCSISAHLICDYNNNSTHFFDLQLLVRAGRDYSLECESVELFSLESCKPLDWNENAHSRI